MRSCANGQIHLRKWRQIHQITQIWGTSLRAGADHDRFRGFLLVVLLGTTACRVDSTIAMVCIISCLLFVFVVEPVEQLKLNSIKGGCDLTQSHFFWGVPHRFLERFLFGCVEWLVGVNDPLHCKPPFLLFFDLARSELWNFQLGLFEAVVKAWLVE